MTPNKYDVGDLVRVSVTFTDAAGTALDPTTVSLSYRKLGGTVTTLVYGTDVAVVKVSTGVYRCDISAASSGRWFYRWHSTGAGQGSEEVEFYVRPSQFA